MRVEDRRCSENVSKSSAGTCETAVVAMFLVTLDKEIMVLSWLNLIHTFLEEIERFSRGKIVLMRLSYTREK